MGWDGDGDGMARDGMGEEGGGRDGTGWEGTGWNRKGWDGKSIVAAKVIMDASVAYLVLCKRLATTPSALRRTSRSFVKGN